MESKWSQVNCKAKSVKMSYTIYSTFSFILFTVFHYLYTQSQTESLPI